MTVVSFLLAVGGLLILGFAADKVGNELENIAAAIRELKQE